MNDRQKRFGVILKKLRLNRNMTQDQLGALIGKSTTAIGQFERGTSFPGFETLEKIICVLNADANLFFEKESADYPVESIWIANLISGMKNDELRAVSRFMIEAAEILDGKVRNKERKKDD